MTSSPSRKPGRGRPDTIWVPRTLAAGVLRPENTLKALAGLHRRDNETGTMLWVNADIAARTGGIFTRNGSQVFKSLHEVRVSRAPKDGSPADDTRLLTVVSGGNGTAYKVAFAAVPHTERLELPAAALWEHTWVTGNVTGPRYGKDTARVAQFLLAILAVGDWDKEANTVTTDLPVVAKRGNRSISHISGLSATKFERAFAVAHQHLQKEPWYSTEQTYRPDGGKHTWRITLNWNLLPAMTAPKPLPATKTDPAKTVEVTPTNPDTFCGVTPTLSAESTPTLSAESPRHFLRAHREATSFSPLLTDPLPSSHPDTQTPDAAATATGKEGGDEVMETVEDLPMADVLRNGRSSQHSGNPQADNTTTTFEEWLLTTVALLCDPSTANRLGLSRKDAQALHGLLKPVYEAGWKPSPLVLALTRYAPPNHGNTKALGYRVKHLPAQVNYVPVTSTAKDREEEAAYQAAASSRYADKYHQRTM